MVALAALAGVREEAVPGSEDERAVVGGSPTVTAPWVTVISVPARVSSVNHVVQSSLAEASERTVPKPPEPLPHKLRLWSFLRAAVATPAAQPVGLGPVSVRTVSSAARASA